ncbi:MAG: DUF2087 domain-containing protein [Clostridiaceae bacterium]|nr:DUF2087 domain-containing protein [Clostridiaceae bacterium]
MENIRDIFWSSSIEDIKKGYIYSESKEKFTCLICGEGFINGIIYPKDNLLMDAEKAVKTHISENHGSVFSFLINLNKRYTGFTDTQKEILTYFYQGLSDKEIIEKQGGGSPSTIRNHRFKLREKEKQARIFLALMELLEGGEREKESSDKLITIHREATMVDDRYVITEAEREKVLKNYIKNGKVNTFPSKEKKKIIILQYMINKFQANKKYSEKEVNEIIKSMLDDYVTVRRYLIQYGFMDRNKDCSEYWVKS